MKAEIWPAPDGWRWRVAGANSEILATGEAYVRKVDAEAVLRLLFGTAGPVDVTIRDHGNRVVKHYTLRSTGTPGDAPTLFDIGPLR
jgi:uncharacterized protein YegP (UPF0339 family)